jgi:spermidine/putrescine transport system permease protein
VAPEARARIGAALLPMALFLAAFFYAPFAILAYQSLEGPGGRLTLSNYAAILRDPTYLRVTLSSIALAVETALATLALALPAAYYIARRAGRGEKGLLLALLLTPFWVDVLLRSFAMKSIIYTLGLREGYAAMMLGMVYEYLPIMFLPLYASLERIPDSALEAARTLGAGRRELALRVILPLALPGVVAGFLLVALMAMTEFVIPALLGGPSGFTVGSLIYYFFLSGGMWGVGAAMATLVTVGLTLAAFLLARWVGEDLAW